jgi:hypothetical protein
VRKTSLEGIRVLTPLGDDSMTDIPPGKKPGYLQNCLIRVGFHLLQGMEEGDLVIGCERRVIRQKERQGPGIFVAERGDIPNVGDTPFRYRKRRQGGIEGGRELIHRTSSIFSEVTGEVCCLCVRFDTPFSAVSSTYCALRGYITRICTISPRFL